MSTPNKTHQNGLHQFLLQILCFGILHFSKDSADITNNPQSKSNKLHKKRIFDSIFKEINNSSQYMFDFEKIKQILQDKLRKYSGDLPSIMKINIFQLFAIKNEFSQEIITLLYCNFWEQVDFSLQEMEYPGETTVITPYTISLLFENFLQGEYSQKVQKGAYYTPKSEIIFTVAITLVNYLQKLLILNKKQYNIENISIYKIIFEYIISGTAISSKIDIEKKRKKKECKEFVNFLSQVDEQFSILDPACGSGAFLIESILILLKINELLKKEGKQPKRIIISGIDINQMALNISEFRIWVVKSLHHCQKDLILSQLVVGDFILDNKNVINKWEKMQFNLILGNPPYIRHRDITDPFNPSKDNNKKYRDNIQNSIIPILNEYPEISKSFQRIDYYLYFFLHSFKLLYPGGAIGFITSNSWMNVKYGYGFQELIAKSMQIKYIFDNRYRSFPLAEIITVITILQKPLLEEISTLKDSVTKFIHFKKKYSNIGAAKHINHLKNAINDTYPNSKIQSNDDEIDSFTIQENDFYRKISCKQEQILNFSNVSNKNEHTLPEPKNPLYEGYNWANYFFNAPSFYFKLHKRLGKEVIFLNEVAEIRRGITTNCNDYFILTEQEKGLYKNGYGELVKIESNYLHPIIISPKQLIKPELKPKTLTTFLFYTNLDKKEIKKRGDIHALSYINYGEKVDLIIKKGGLKGTKINGVQNLSSFVNKFRSKPNSWYCLKPGNRNHSVNQLKGTKIPKHENGKNEKYRIIVQKIYNTKYKFGICKEMFIPNNTFYEITVKHQYAGLEKLIFSLILGSLSILSIELQGRTNFGGGALDTATFDIGNILILNPKLCTSEQQQNLISKADLLLNLPFLNTAEEFSRKERNSLDDYILNLISNNFEREELYRAIQKIQELRIKRSKKY
jgi:Eco57I restriction-modification methylase